MHVDRFVRGKGQFMLTEYVATEERVGPRFPLLLTTGRILSQYNVGAQTRRTANIVWHEEDVLEIHPFDAEQRGVRDGDLVALQSRAGEIALRAKVSERMQPGVVYTTFHHAVTGANVVTTDNSDWATNCPEYKVTAVQVRRTNHLSDWQMRDREEAVALRRDRRRRWPMPPSDGGRARSTVETRAYSYDAGAGGPAVRARVAVEAPVQIVIGGAPFAVMMATPHDLEDFAYGFAADRGDRRAPRRHPRRRDRGGEEGWRIDVALAGEQTARRISRASGR